MKIHKIYIILLLINHTVNSQFKENYFLKVLDSTTSKELKLNTLDSLLIIYETKDVKAFAKYTETFINEAIQQEKYEKAIDRAVVGSYYISTVLGQPKRSLKLLEQVEKYKSYTSNSELLGDIYVKKGGVYLNLSKLKMAIENYSKAINYYSDKDSIYIADAIYFRGQANFKIGNFMKSINDYTLANKYYEDLGEKDYVYFTRESIISIYGATGFTQKAIDERKKLINDKIKNKHFDYLGNAYYNQSISYKKVGDLNKEEECLKLALKYNLADKSMSYFLIVNYAQLGKYYAVNNQFNEAKKYFDLAKKEIKDRDKESELFLSYQLALSHYLYKTRRLKEAEKILISLKSKKPFENNNFRKVINNLLHNIYDESGNKAKALEYFKEYSRIKDSLATISQHNGLSYYQTLYETKRQEKEINDQQNSILLLEKENEGKQRLLIYLALGGILLFFLLYFYWNSLQLKNEKKIQENYSQKLLLAQEEERKRISKDLHDGLGQSLLLIKHKIRLTKDESTKELVNSTIEEMRTISKVLYPFQLKDIGITKAIENLIIQLDDNYKDTYIFGNIDSIDGLLEINQEVNVFRIVQECLSNIIKHAEAESAKVEVIRNDNSIRIEIRDNGVGFNFSKKINDFKSLGLKTIKDRVKLLGGTLKIDSQIGTGTLLLITFDV